MNKNSISTKPTLVSGVTNLAWFLSSSFPKEPNNGPGSKKKNLRNIQTVSYSGKVTSFLTNFPVYV